MSGDRIAEEMLAESTGPAPTAGRRALTLLQLLRETVPYDGAWLGCLDPRTGDPRCLARSHPAGGDERLSGAATTHRDEGATTTRLTSAGRDVGLLVLRFADGRPPAADHRQRVEGLAPLIAHGIDPLRSVIATAQLAPGARAAVLLGADGSCLPLPGAGSDPLLVHGSPVVAISRSHLEDGSARSTFLWPAGADGAPGSYTRITALRAPPDAPPGSLAVVTSAVETRVRGLSPRELAVLGLVVEGCSNQEIARSLWIAPRTAATHLEHILRKLDAPTRTLAAVRAQQSGLYTPVQLWWRGGAWRGAPLAGAVVEFAPDGTPRGPTVRG